jgi:hypothetical protein
LEKRQKWGPIGIALVYSECIPNFN